MYFQFTQLTRLQVNLKIVQLNGMVNENWQKTAGRRNLHNSSQNIDTTLVEFVENRPNFWNLIRVFETDRIDSETIPCMLFIPGLLVIYYKISHDKVIITGSKYLWSSLSWNMQNIAVLWATEFRKLLKLVRVISPSCSWLSQILINFE